MFVALTKAYLECKSSLHYFQQSMSVCNIQACSLVRDFNRYTSTHVQSANMWYVCALKVAVIRMLLGSWGTGPSIWLQLLATLPLSSCSSGKAQTWYASPMPGLPVQALHGPMAASCSCMPLLMFVCSIAHDAKRLLCWHWSWPLPDSTAILSLDYHQQSIAGATRCRLQDGTSGIELQTQVPSGQHMHLQSCLLKALALSAHAF